MIVRISSEGQYQLDSGLLDRLNELDEALIGHIAEGDEPAFHEGFQALIELIRSEGTPLDPEELVESHVIVPRPDITVEEARAFFSGDGLFPADYVPST